MKSQTEECQHDFTNPWVHCNKCKRDFECSEDFMAKRAYEEGKKAGMVEALESANATNLDEAVVRLQDKIAQLTSEQELDDNKAGWVRIPENKLLSDDVVGSKVKLGIPPDYAYITKITSLGSKIEVCLSNGKVITVDPTSEQEEDGTNQS